MTTYKYKGVSPDGARVSGVIKAYDEFEAVSQLRETCSVVTKIEAVPEQKEGGVSFGSRRIKAKELAILCSQFAIILTSGLPIDRCVEMVAAQARSREIQRVLEHVAEDVSGGYSLARALPMPAPLSPSRLSRPFGPVSSPARWSCASTGSTNTMTNPPRPTPSWSAP